MVWLLSVLTLLLPLFLLGFAQCAYKQNSAFYTQMFSMNLTLFQGFNGFLVLFLGKYLNFI